MALLIFGGAIDVRAVTLAWNPNPESDIGGYRLFWGETNAPATSREVGNTTQTQVTNLAGGRTYYFYLTAYNSAGLESDPSSTVFYSQPQSGQIPAAPSNLSGVADSPTQIRLQWSDNSSNETGFRLLRSTNGTYLPIELPANTTNYTDIDLTPATQCSYKVHAFNSAGNSPDSATISVSTQSTPPPLSGGARFLEADWNSGGSWKAGYGRDGYAVVADSEQDPAYASLTPLGYNSWIWNWETADGAALERAGTSARVAACWFAPEPFQLDVPLSGAGPYRLSVYCLDWDMGGRIQQLEILDPTTGQILDRQSISNFTDGVYLTWEITKPVTVKVSPVVGANAVVSGVFFDSAAAVSSPEFSPDGGTFSNSVTVAISTPTSGATIHYTLDGTVPTANSPAYTGSITLTNTATIRARASKEGLVDSSVRAATFTRSGVTDRVRFVGANTTRGGTWKGSLGSEGQMIAYETPGLPGYASASFAGANTWIWSFPSTSPAALERPYQNGRIASTWYNSTFTVNLTLRDTQPHRLSLYCLDYEGGRTQTVEIIDPTTGAQCSARFDRTE